MSHFIIRSNSAIILGTPNGHARTQFEQAMHRGLRAVITRPSALRLMASAGQTSAQVGLWQCIQTTGTVWTDVLRSTYSMWIIECPLCVSHSEQACSQAWHPMHRCGSTKNSISAGIPPSRFATYNGYQDRRVFDPADRVQGPRGQVQHLAGGESPGAVAACEVDCPLQAVDRGVARGRVTVDVLPGPDD